MLASLLIWEAASAQLYGPFELVGAKLVNDSPAFVLSAAPANRTGSPGLQPGGLSALAQKNLLTYTKKARPVELWYFPGRSNKKALVVGGMHGTELPSIEIARHLIERLACGEKPFYTVLVIPCLFPDNAATALQAKNSRLTTNAGRYSNEHAADPNRQMPEPGKPFLLPAPQDAKNREIEPENQALLQLIQWYQPHRLLNIHAIRDQSKAGIFADPRTDCRGIALGFETDQELALAMARHICERG